MPDSFPNQPWIQLALDDSVPVVSEIVDAKLHVLSKEVAGLINEGWRSPTTISGEGYNSQQIGELSLLELVVWGEEQQFPILVDVFAVEELLPENFHRFIPLESS